jgi:outer membrane protein OmpA-like peptidoglycan-associated protein/flagellar hook assembly protein FlgD
LAAALALLALPAMAQENALDWHGPRAMSFGSGSAGSEGPYADAGNPAASAEIQRPTLDLSFYGIGGFASEPGFGGWINLGAVLPTTVGNFTVAGHFGSSPSTFPSLAYGTLAGLNLSFSKDLLDDLNFGVGLGFQIGSPLNTTAVDWGLGLDLGFIHKVANTGFIKDFQWGVALRNLGKAYWSSYGAMPYNLTPAIGTQFKFIKTDDAVLGFNADLSFPVFQNVQLKAGLDFLIFKLISFQVAYDFDLVQTLNRYSPGWAGSYVPVSQALSRSLPLSFGLSLFFKSSDKEAEARGETVPFYANSEYNPSLVVAPLNNGIMAFGLGLNMPIGVIDIKPPVLEIGEPVFEDTPPADEAKPADAKSASDATVEGASTSSAWSAAYLPVGADTPAAPAGGSAEGSSAPAPAASPAAPVPEAAVPSPSPSAAPVTDPARAAGLATGAPVYLSPNFDGVRDTLTLPLNLKDDRPIASYTLYISNEKGMIVRTIRNKVARPATADLATLWERLFRVKTGLTVPKTLAWDGRGDDGNVVPDGLYAYQVEAADDNGNVARTALRPVVIDTRNPELATESNAPSFAPGGDRPVLVFSLDSAATLAPIDAWTGAVANSEGKAVRNWTWSAALPPQTVWDGKTDQGIIAPDGLYSFKLSATDRAGNKGAAEVGNLLLLNKPTPLGLTIDIGYFSPNADGIKDAVTVAINTSDQVKVNSWTGKLLNSKGQAVRNYSDKTPGLAEAGKLPKSIRVDGLDDGGKPLPEDSYKLVVAAQFENGNNPSGTSPAMTLDLTKPSITVVPEYPVFSPNGDGFKDSLMLRQKASSEPLWEGQILSADGRKVRGFSWRGQPDDSLIWDGRDAANAVAADGSYTYQVTATDLAGNVGFSSPVVIKVDNRPTAVSVRSARAAFAPGTASPYKTMPLALDEKLAEGIASWSLRILKLPADQAKLNPAQAKSLPQAAGFSGKGLPRDELAWDGRKGDGVAAEDGQYVAEYTVVYDKGDQPQSYSDVFTIKNRVPTVSLKVADDNLFFSPDGDGKQDSITFEQASSEEESWDGTVSDAGDNIVKRVSWQGKAPAEFVWDGTDDHGNKVPDGDYKYFLATTDAAGNQASARLTPIKLVTVKPEVSLSVASSAFSPKAGSSKPTMELRPLLKLNSDTDIKDWRLQVAPAAGGSARNITGSGKVPETLLWDGKTDGGRVAPDGDYLATLTVNYKSGQTPVAQSPKFALDTTPPAATVFADPVLFSPNGDGQKDTVALSQETSRESAWKATISFANPPAGTDPVVRSFAWTGAAPKSVSWNGVNAQGITVPDGRYLYVLEATDAAGNYGKSAPAEIRVDNRSTPIAIKADKRWFSPVIDAKHRQVLAPSVVLAEGIEGWQLEIRDAKNQTVRSFKGTDNPPVAVEWDGKTDSGAMAVDGDYSAVYSVSYLKGDKPQVKTEVFTMDTKAPEIKITVDDTVFSPDPESQRPVLQIQQASSQEELWEGSVQTPDGKPVKSFFWKGQAQNFAWDGRDDNGNLQKDGAYKFVVGSTDKAGNTVRQELKGIVIDTRPTPVLLMADAKGFAPGTGRAAVSTISFKPLLTLAEGVSGWNLKLVNNSQNAKVERSFTGAGLPPAAIAWDGMRDDKTIAGEGKYEAILTVAYRKGNQPEAHSNAFVLDVSAPKAQMQANPKPFSPDDDGEEDEVTVNIAVEDLSPIKEWSLEILEPKTDGSAPAHFVTFNGTGTPTSRIIWNGHSDTGELVQAAMDYIAVLTVTDNLGNKGSYRENLPVDVLVLRDGNDLRIRIPGIAFPPNSPDLNSKDLKPEQLAQNARTLDRLAEILRKYGSYQIVVEGHANITKYWSASEADKENKTELQPLSEKRAQAVKDALAKRGIAASRLSITGMGGSRPVVPNNDLPNVWKNRRVEFLLKK